VVRVYDKNDVFCRTLDYIYHKCQSIYMVFYFSYYC